MQSTEEKPQARPATVKAPFSSGHVEGRGDLYVWVLSGGVELRFADEKLGEQELEAQTVVLWLDTSDIKSDIERKQGEAPPPGAEEKEPPAYLEGLIGLSSIREFYAEGGVRYVHGEVTLDAEELYLNLREGHGLMQDVAVRARVERPNNPNKSEVVIRAREMQQLTPELLRAEDAQFSPCPYGKPHYHVRSERLQFEGSLIDGTGIVDASSNRMVIGDTTVSPLPGVRWQVGTDPPLPIRAVSFGHSSRFGTFGLIRWGANMSSVGQSIHEALGITGPFRGTWLLDTDYYSRRGFGTGLGFEYEGRRSIESKTVDLYFGKTRSYFIHDKQDEDGDGTPITNHDRGWVNTQNRFFLPDKFRLDAELSYVSDSNFLQEYFEKVAKEEQEQQTYLYLEKLWGRQGMTLLGRWRLNDFQTQAEYLPRLAFRSIGEPLFEVPFLPDVLPDGAFFYHTNASEVSNARRRPSDLLEPPFDFTSERVVRVDSVDTFTLPFDLAPYGLTASYENRFTYFSRTQDQGGAWRYAGAVGASASTEFHRTFEATSSLFNIDGIRHIVIPTVEYQNRFATTIQTDELFVIDETETVTKIEQFLLSLDQRWQTRRGKPVQVVDFLRLLLEQPIFLAETREANDGDALGLLHGELTFNPGVERYPLKNLRFFAQADYDWNDNICDQVGLGMGVEPSEGLSLAASYRVLRGISRVLTAEVSYKFGPKWEVAVLEQRDLDENFLQQRDVILRRYGHDYVAQLAYEVDPGEDDRGVAFSFTPLILWNDRGRSALPSEQRPLLSPFLGPGP